MNTTNALRSDYAGPCPRCQGPVPRADMQGKYPGALSRVDNATYICSACGTDEAMFQFHNRTKQGASLPPVDQPVYA